MGGEPKVLYFMSGVLCFYLEVGHGNYLYMETLRQNHESVEQHDRDAIFFVPIDRINVSEKQIRKISRDKVERHKKRLLEHDDDLLPIDAHELEGGNFIIDGNGRHRFFAYKELGYTSIPLNIKSREGFQPTRIEKNR
jgi:hypothetical protein